MNPVAGVSGGRHAGISGSGLEKAVKSHLETFGFKAITAKRYERVKDAADRPPRLLVKNMPYKNIYGTAGKTEFLIDCLNPNWTKEFPEDGRLICRVECKRQKVAGSVDEKYPYLYLCCIEAMPEKNIILLCEIDGARPQARQWLCTAVQNRPYTDSTKPPKRLHLMGLIEFMNWADGAFIGY